MAELNMPHTLAGDAVRHCVVCHGLGFGSFATRADGVEVVQCLTCHMGVIDKIPNNLADLYGDDYYGSPEQTAAGEQGYSDYKYTAEHGVAWAAALVELLRPNGGAVLDIGCADGYLLAKLDERYQRFGIEVNETMGDVATSHGVTMLARDLFDPELLRRNAGKFDVITGIAVFEHLADIRSGVEAALSMLRQDGLLLFEVPLISAIHDNTVWLTSSLEHVWYPTELAIRRLFETELGLELVGRELSITGYGSTYIGVAARHGPNTQTVMQTAQRIFNEETEPANRSEMKAMLLLRLVHAAQRSYSTIDSLAFLQENEINPALLRRVAELWKADFYLRNMTQGTLSEALAKLEAQSSKLDDLAQERKEWHAEAERLLVVHRAERLRAQQLYANYEVAASDHVQNRVELTAHVVAQQARASALDRQLTTQSEQISALVREKLILENQVKQHVTAEAQRPEKRELEHVRSELDDIREVASAAQLKVASISEELLKIQQSQGWFLIIRLRRMATRHPRAAMVAIKAGRLLWWTARGKLIAVLRSRNARNNCAKISALPEAVATVSETVATTSSIEEAPIFEPKLGNFLSGSDDGPVLLSPTGHRPAPYLTTDASEWPLVSIVITSFNYGRLVTDAVESALAQTFSNLEVIVVEGGSSNPDSRFNVAAMQGDRVRVLMQGAGHSAGANRNYGISQARGKYICCLDADDMLAPTYVEKAVYMLERQGYDVVSCALEMFGNVDRVVHVMEQPDLAALLQSNNVVVCGLFRRTLWERSGGFRDTDRAVTGYVYEDWAFWVRLAALGARFYNLFHDPMLRYRVHGPSQSRGRDVLPIWKQRQMVHRLNDDVLQNLPALIAHSKRRAAAKLGTPSWPMPDLLIEPAARAGSHRPSLLLALPFMILGGGERLLSAVVGHLVREGWRVVIVTSIPTGAEHGNTEPWFAQHTREIFHLHRGFRQELWTDVLNHLIRSRNIDLLWIVGSVAAYDALRCLRAVNPQLRVADLLFNTVGHTQNNCRRRDMIDVTFVESHAVREWLLEHGAASEHIMLVESGVDLMEHSPAPRAPDVLMKIGATETDIIVGFSGRWSEEKNPLGFIEIARQVDPTLPIRFVMTGTGHLREAIEEAIRAASFQPGRFHLLGPVPDLKPVLACYDLLVLPSILDGRPVVALEALAMGVPILASRVGGLPDLVREDDTGWLCDPAELGSFAQRIEKLAREPGRRTLMRQAARRFAEEHLDSQAMYSAYQRGLTSLLPPDQSHV